MNTNGQNTAEIYDVHKIDEFLIENGLRSLSRELKLTTKGSMSKSSMDRLRKILLSKLEGLPGGMEVYEILSTRLADGRQGSMGMPLIADKVISIIASIVSSATTAFRFAGSKLVLQADLGPVEVTNSDGTKTIRHLKWRDSEGYCEVILPEEYRDFFDVGDKFGANSKDKAIKDGIVGFRIPTSNYHSLVPMKVVGFYKSPPGSKGNVVIAPSAIVYYHGSDYDVDTLFVIKKEKYTKDTVNLNNLLQKFDPTHKENPDLIVAKNSVPGFSDNKELLFDGNKLHEYLIPMISKASSVLKAKFDATRGMNVLEKRKASKEIEELEKSLDTISAIAAIAAKNAKVDLLSNNLRDIKNRKDLLTPITFTEALRIRHKVKGELREALTIDDKFLNNLQKNNLITIKCN